jgi:hypothetical protein
VIERSVGDFPPGVAENHVRDPRWVRSGGWKIQEDRPQIITWQNNDLRSGIEGSLLHKLGMQTSPAGGTGLYNRGARPRMDTQGPKCTWRNSMCWQIKATRSSGLLVRGNPPTAAGLTRDHPFAVTKQLLRTLTPKFQSLSTLHHRSYQRPLLERNLPLDCYRFFSAFVGSISEDFRQLRPLKKLQLPSHTVDIPPHPSRGGSMLRCPVGPYTNQIAKRIRTTYQ